jgi:hypothetical protein
MSESNFYTVWLTWPASGFEMERHPRMKKETWDLGFEMESTAEKGNLPTRPLLDEWSD